MTPVLDPVEARPQSAAPAAPPAVLAGWLGTQALNSFRHAAALRPFARKEFEAGVSTPSEGHIQAVNQLMDRLRGELLARTGKMRAAARRAASDQEAAHIDELLVRKERAHDAVRAVEKIWDFYFELFGQRQSRYGHWLVSCDRIALDCYQEAYMHTGIAKSIPAPPAFSYMRTGFSPATFRRGIRLSKMGQINPFPLIQLPYHRLINPWTLGATLHEVSHNLQTDLGLSRAIPFQVAKRLLQAGMNPRVAAVWTRWNRETFADLSGLLLGGPAVVSSLMDVLGRGPATVTTYAPRAPHPTPYLRMLISCELLRRMGFSGEAEIFRRAWLKLYPSPHRGTIPRALLESFPEAHKIVVDAMCYQPYKTLGGRSLSQLYSFAPKHQRIVEEAAGRLAAGNDPGVVPERFLIGAARVALDRKLAQPRTIAENFYQELSRR